MFELAAIGFCALYLVLLWYARATLCALERIQYKLENEDNQPPPAPMAYVFHCPTCEGKVRVV